MDNKGVTRQLLGRKRGCAQTQKGLFAELFLIEH
jgi:hypothetical protein